MTTTAAEPVSAPNARSVDPAAEWVDMGTLVPWAKNPRKNDHAVDGVVDSLITFGWGRPLIARRANSELVAGHTTMKAAQRLAARWAAEDPAKKKKWHPEAVTTAELGIVPARFVDLSERQAHQLALADNRLAESSQWDDEAVYSILSEWDKEEVHTVGWSDKELAELGRDRTEGEVVEDEVPEPPADPITKPGDLWMLGDHRLYCGDSANPASWELLVAEGERFDCVFTDPPYGVDYVGKTADALVVHNDGAEALPALLGGAFDNVLARCNGGCVWYVCAPPGPHMGMFSKVLVERGLWRQSIAWIKDQFVLGHSDYHYQHEQIFYGWTEGAHMAPPDRKQTTVWEFDRPKASREHPTMKPVALVAHALSMSSIKGHLVGEPFGGSGTTLIACEQLGRVCRTIEIAPEYCDVIVQRWETLTGKKASRKVRDE